MKTIPQQKRKSLSCKRSKVKIPPRKYHPDKLLKPSGVHSFYLGRDGDPLVEVFDSYCKINQTTFSHGIRNILADFFREKNLLDQEGNFLPSAEDFRQKADKAREEQREMLAAGLALKAKRNRKRSVV